MVFFIFAIIVLCAVVYIAYQRKDKNKNSRMVENAIQSVKDQAAEKKEEKRIDGTKTLNAPFGMYQGKMVTLSPDVTSKSLVPGSMLPTFPESSKVVAVGILNLLGFTVYRSYLNDDSTFIQTIVDEEGSIQEVDIFSKVVETNPDEEGWDFLLNDEDGAIGNPVFNLKGKTGEDVGYTREWPEPKPGDESRVDPINTTERVVDESGNTYVMDLKTMGYARDVSTYKELMVVQAYQMDNAGNRIAGCDSYVGFELENESSFTVV